MNELILSGQIKPSKNKHPLQTITYSNFQAKHMN